MKTLVIITFAIGVQAAAIAQDTLKLSLQQAEKIFLEKNLFLLAKQYDLDIADAQLVQVRLYPNPTFSADLNFYDAENKQLFFIGKNGQKIYTLEQLIILGGKRKSDIAFAKTSKTLAQAEFTDLLRNLQFQLRKSYFSVFQAGLMIDKYNQQLQVLDSMIVAYEQQSKKGNIPAKEVVRLKSVYLKISASRSEVISTKIEKMQEVQILLQSAQVILPDVSYEIFNSLIQLAPYPDLLNEALEKRSDLKGIQVQNELALLRIKQQKQLAIPDLALQFSYDQRGNAFLNQYSVGFTAPLPLWNRNKGNIKIAQIEQKRNTLFIEQKKQEIANEVLAAWQEMRKSIDEYRQVQKIYSADFAQVFEGVKTNFQKRNVSLLEFVDFFEAYNETLAEYERIQVQLLHSAALINFVTASNIYTL